MGEALALARGEGCEESFLLGGDDGLGAGEVGHAGVGDRQDRGAAVVLARRPMEQAIAVQAVDQA